MSNQQLFGGMVLMFLLTSGFAGFMIYDAVANEPGREIERLTNKAQCHAVASELGHTSYEILRSGQGSCQIVTPDGGIPWSLGWFENHTWTERGE